MSESRRSKIARFGGYFSWTAADQFIELGVPRLLLFPLMYHVMGTDQMDVFLVAFGMVMLFGISPSKGLSGYVMRDAAHHEEVDHGPLMRTVITLAALALLPLVLLFVAFDDAIAVFWGSPDAARLLPAMGIYLVTLNMLHTATTIYRYHRNFGRMVAVHAFQSALQFLAIPGYFAFGLPGVAYGFAAAGIGGFLAILFVERRTLFARPLLESQYARGALRVWLPVSISSFLVLSAGSLDKLLISKWGGGTGPAVFFAAAASARILLIPGSQFNTLLFSLLGKARSSKRFSQRFYTLYFVISIGVSLLIWGAGLFVGHYVLLLYKPAAAAAAPLLPWTIAGVAGMSVQAALRPFINKFLPPGYLPWMAALGVTGRIVPLLLLVPTRGPLGAAQAMCIGGLFAAAIWAAVYVWKFVLSDADHSSRVGDDPSSNEETGPSRPESA